MAERFTRIPFEEFSENLVRIFDRLISEGEEVFVETREGELIAVKAVFRSKSRRRAKTEEDYSAFLASAGGWKDIDVDSFLKDNYESRSMSMRSAVEI